MVQRALQAASCGPDHLRRYNSIQTNYERIFDIDGGTCGSNCIFPDVYTSMRLTFQVYSGSGCNLDNFWLVGDGQVHTYTFTLGSGTGARAYRDGVLMCQSSGTSGIPSASRTSFKIGGSSCTARLADRGAAYGVL